MTLEWINPPHDYRDDCADIAAELHTHPGKWALILTQSAHITDYTQELEKHGITTRWHNTHEVSSGHPDYQVWDIGDLYARAPKENNQ